MSRRAKEEMHGGDEMNTVLVVNPREEVIGDSSDEVIMAVESYSGEVYRLDNIERMEHAAEFYETQEHLMETIPEITEDEEYVDPFWYDKAFLFDSGGLDSNDQGEVTRESSTLEFLGGPLEDIATVVASLEAGGQEASYVLNHDLTFDYGGWNPEQGYVVDEMTSLGELLEADEPGMQQRIEHHRLDRDNIYF